MGDITDGAAEVLGLCIVSFVSLLVLWFFWINYIGDEIHHPLDFYSYKLRSKPFLFAFEVLTLGGVIAALVYTGRVRLLLDNVPELASAVFLEGFVVGGAILVYDSVAAAITALTLYVFVGTASVFIVLVPLIPVRRPGIFYSAGFFVLNIIWIAWMKYGLHKNGTEHLRQKLPEPARNLPAVWGQAVYIGNPLLIIVTSALYAVEHLVEDEQYGIACALSFYIVTGLLMLGCCHGFNANIVEDGEH